MIFLTVGTQFPFDRLVRAVDEVVGGNRFKENIFAQIGVTSYRPKNFESASELGKILFDKYFSEAEGVISHAGMGTITMAWEKKKPLLVMPRLKKYGEVVNNHQLDIAKRFEKLGYLLVAHGKEDLSEKMQQLKTFVPRERTTQTEAVSERISQFLKTLSYMDGKK
jgi:beta-1,4-N-acetylglucosaminyltransferase